MKYNDRERRSRLHRFCLSALLLLGLAMFLHSCGSKKIPMTMRLFMQTAGANVELPESNKDNARVTEQVALKDTVIEYTSANLDSVGDIAKTVELNEVEVIASHRVIERVLERSGEATLIFYVKANRALLDSCWRLTLTPELINSDSIVQLPSVVISGEGFRRVQDEQYRAYDDFLHGIVPESKYNNAFIDIDGIHSDIRARQKMFWRISEADRKRQLAYVKWKTLMDLRRGYINMKAQGNRDELRQRMKRNTLEKSVEYFMQGADTTGIRDSYVQRYERRVKLWPVYRLQKEMSLQDVPRVFQPIWLSGGRFEDIHNYSFTPKDSVEIASNRLFRREIAKNEYARDHQELMRERIIRLPRIDDVRVSEIADPSADFTYMYIHKIPVVEGVRSVNVTLRGQVFATDYSVWSTPPADTLTFVVASVADLADETLLSSFNMAGDSLTNYGYEQYSLGLKALQDRQYQKALSLLRGYGDYNTAVALTCTGYHLESEALLGQLNQTAPVEYLRAIVAVRLENYQEAVDFLLEACRKDSKYAYRKNIDADINALIPRFMGLEEELERIAMDS